MGTPCSSSRMTVFVHRSGCSGTLVSPEDLPLRPRPVHLPDPDPLPAGLVRRAADPARAEPAGRPRPRAIEQDRSAPSATSPTPSTSPARSPRCASRMGDVATRDFVRSELRDLLEELEERGSRCADVRQTTARRRPTGLRRTSARPSMGACPQPDDAPTTRPRSTDDALRQALTTVIDPEIRSPSPSSAWSRASTLDDGRPRRVDDPADHLGLPAEGHADQGHHRGPRPRCTASTRRRRQPRRHERRAARGAAHAAARRRRRARDPVREPGSLTRVYAVASGKGGVGKSTVTANLAASLAAQRAAGRASSTPTSTASRSRACSASSTARRRSTT